MSRFTDTLADHPAEYDFRTYHYVCRCGVKWPALHEDYDAEIALHAAHVESMLVEAGVVAVELPDAKSPTPALIEAAYIAQDDLSKPPDQWTITAAAEIIDMYIRAQGRTKVHVLGHPAAAVRPVTPEEPR